MLQLSLRLTDFSRLRPLILTVFWVRLSADDSKTLHEKKKKNNRRRHFASSFQTKDSSKHASTPTIPLLHCNLKTILHKKVARLPSACKQRWSGWVDGFAKKGVGGLFFSSAKRKKSAEHSRSACNARQGPAQKAHS